MNGNRRLELALISLMVVAVWLAPAMAQPTRPGHRGPNRSDDSMGWMFHRLDVTEDQRAEVRAVVDQHREQMQPQQQQVSERQLELFDRIHAAELDESAIRDAAMAVATVEAELAVARAGLLQEIRQILTPEQLESVEEMLERRRDGLAQGDGGGSHRFRGPGGRP